MKILIAVMGAEPHIRNGMHQMQRETWGRDAHLLGDLRFFLGRGEQPLQSDEVRLDCEDDLPHLLEKDVEIFRWAIQNGYGAVLKVDTDTYVNVAEVAKHGHWGLDYVGAAVGTLGETYGDTGAWAFVQGSATWLSSKAMGILIEEVIGARERLMPALMKYNGLLCPYPQSDDLWTGQVLIPYVRRGALRSLEDPRYTNGPFTFHFGYNKEMAYWMENFRACMVRLSECRNDHGLMKQVHERRMPQ